MQHYQFPAEIFSPSANDLLDKSMDDIITKGLFKMLQLGHRPTAVHSINVARMAAGLVTGADVKDLVDCPVEFVRDAILHDVGKLRISPKILDEPGRLSDEQFTIIRRHPTVGFLIVRSFDEGRAPVQNRAARILLSHFTQRYPYPNAQEVSAYLDQFNEDNTIVNNEDFMLTSIALNIADHFDARFPCTPAQATAHDYNDRDYPVSAMPLMVEASFAESKKVRDLNLVNLDTGRLDSRLIKIIEFCGERALAAAAINN